jgi:hypothetical protein
VGENGPALERQATKVALSNDATTVIDRAIAQFQPPVVVEFAHVVLTDVVFTPVVVVDGRDRRGG